MGDLVLYILLIIGVALVAALVVGGWVIVAIVRLIARAFGAGAGSKAERMLISSPRRVRCPHARCRADNPERARFCRRCGKMLHAAAPQVARKVAMW